VAIVVVGTNADTETEGEDRTSLALPGDQDELVTRVLAANPRTVVVVNTGGPVTLPWSASAPALLQTWFGGQEMADALVDVLFGEVDPGGRLAVSFPRAIEQTPAFGNFPGEHGEVRYGEGFLVGYRWYDSRGLVPTFPFGYGLSYATFEIGAPVGGVGPLQHEDGLTRIEVPVTNTGDRRGSEVVQAYVAPPRNGPRFRPARELRAFAKVHLDPGEVQRVTLDLSDRAFAAWEPVRGWTAEPGTYAVHIGRSCADIAHVVDIVVP
jgi:beta-glucosidase